MKKPISEALDVDDDDVTIRDVKPMYTMPEKERNRALATGGVISGYEVAFIIQLLAIISSPVLDVTTSMPLNDAAAVVATRILASSTNITLSLASSAAVVNALNVSAAALAVAALQISSAIALDAASPSSLPVASAASSSTGRLESYALALVIAAAVCCLGAALYVRRRRRTLQMSKNPFVKTGALNSLAPQRNLVLSTDPSWHNRDRTPVSERHHKFSHAHLAVRSPPELVIQSTPDRTPRKQDFYVSRDMIYDDQDF